MTTTEMWLIGFDVFFLAAIVWSAYEQRRNNGNGGWDATAIKYWIGQAKDWERRYEQERRRSARLEAMLAGRPFLERTSHLADEDEGGDPMSVTEADRMAVEAQRREREADTRRRPLAHGRVPLQTKDEDARPVPETARAEVSDLDENDPAYAREHETETD